MMKTWLKRVLLTIICLICHYSPYAHSPSVRKLSKIATLLLAKNYILVSNAFHMKKKLICSDLSLSKSPNLKNRPKNHFETNESFPYPLFQMQQNALEELRRLLTYIQSTTGAAPLDLGSFPAAAKLQQLLNAPNPDNL